MSKVTILDVIEKASENGPYYEPRKWDMEFIPKVVSEKLREHGLRGAVDPKTPIPSDDGLANNFWKAGFELAVETGMLCTDTRRIIKFTDDELKQCLREAPDKIVAGSGMDTRTFCKRRVEDKRPLTCILGPFGAMVSEDLFIPLNQSTCQYAEVDGIIPGFLATCYGREAKSGTPTEIMAMRLRGILTREAARRAGRPGMIVTYGGPTFHGCVGTILANEPGLYLATVAATAELKVNMETLSKVTTHVERGDIRLAFHHSFIGGYAGGPEGATLTRIAAMILSIPVLQGSLLQSAVYDMRYTGTDGREALWANSVSSQAMSLNSRFLCCDLNNPVAGACTDMLLQEVAVNAINNVVDGNSWMLGVRTGGGKYPNNTTGLESKFAAEVQRAASGMKRSDANEIVSKIISKYEAHLRDPPLGKTFPECFDAKTLKPSEEWQKIYGEVWRELGELGLIQSS